jgi:RHS repeat-associated protein
VVRCTCVVPTSYGKEQDQLTNLSYYGARYFDPLSLTWTQADPLYRFAPYLAFDEPRRMNLYTFNLQNPLAYVDPDGQNPAVAVVVCAETPGCAAAIAAGAVLVYTGAKALAKGTVEVIDDIGEGIVDRFFPSSPTPKTINSDTTLTNVTSRRALCA